MSTKNQIENTVKSLRKIESFTSREALWYRKYKEIAVKSPYICLFEGTDRDFANEQFVIHRSYRKKTGWEISLKETGAILDNEWSARTRHDTLEKLMEFLKPMAKSDIDRLNESAKKNMEDWELVEDD